TANFTGTVTATGGLTTLSNLLTTGSSTLQNFTGVNSTTTNATTTSLAITGVASQILTVNASGSIVPYAAQTCTNQFARSWTALGVVTCASVSNTDWSGTDLSVSNGGTGLSTFGGTNTILYTTAADTLSSEAAFLYDPATNILTADSFMAVSSSTLQNFTFVSATGTRATTTSFFATTASSTNLFATTFNTGLITSGLINSQTISSSANFTGTLTVTSGLTTLSNILVTGSSTLQNFTAINSTSTSATTTNLFATNASTTNLRSNTATIGSLTVGDCVGCGSGGGYATVQDDTQGALTQRTTLSFEGTGIDCVDNAGNSSTDCTVNAGAATAAGNTNEIQFNTGDSLDSDPVFIWDNTNNRLGVGSTTPTATLSASSTSSTVSAAIIDQRGTGGLLSLQQSGIDRFVVANSGGISVFGATTDIVKTTTGTDRTQDFSVTGSTLTNVTSSNDVMKIDDGTISGQGTVAATSTLTNSTIGNGAFVMLRDDGQYIIAHGASTTGATRWNGMTNGTLSAAATNPVSTGGIGNGATAIRRPDGKYLVIHAGLSFGKSTLYDPNGITASAAGPNLCAAATMATGTTATLRFNGRYLITCGGQTSTSIYDPVANSVTVGPTTAGAGSWGPGAMALQRPDGSLFMFVGGGTAAVVYNEYGGTVTAVAGGGFTIGTTSRVILSNQPTINGGAVAIKRPDGKYLVMGGAAGTSVIYDPVATTANPYGTFTSTGVGPSVALSEGAQALWRQDGKYLLIMGTSTAATTNVVDPGDGSIPPTFITASTPSFTGPFGLGVTSFMLPDGKYAILRGGVSSVIETYDINYVVGGTGGGSQGASYETECISSTNLNTDSTLNWNTNQEGVMSFQIRTSTSPAPCSSATYRDIPTSGGLVGATTTADNQVQVKVFFKKDLPKAIQQEWGIRKSGTPNYPMIDKDPALYDFTIDNGTALKRDQFTFGMATASTTAPQSGPITLNMTNNLEKGIGLSLIRDGLGATLNANVTAANAAPGTYNGGIGSHSVLATGTGSTTLVMKRPDGKFVLIAGNATPNAQLYDPTLQTFTALGTTPTTVIGNGSLTIKRPDGKFLIVMGNSLSRSTSTVRTTNIFDPVADTFSLGPDLTSPSGKGALTIPLPNGRSLIIHGDYATTTSIYDPLQNTMTVGPSAQATIGEGALAIPNADGTFLIIAGNTGIQCTTQTVTNLFNPYTMTFSANTGLAPATGNGPGALAFQRKDGQWVILNGATTAGTCAVGVVTSIYNPIGKNLVAGTNAPTGIGLGAFAVPTPNGMWLISPGAGSTATYFYDEETGAFTANGLAGIGRWISTGPTFLTAVNSGGLAFQRDDGKFVVVTGAATTTTGTVVQVLDAGWAANGTYKTEQFNLSPVGTKLDSNSTLVWKANTGSGITAQVRTAPTQAALGTTTPREIASSGGLINPSATDVWLQIDFSFRRIFNTYSNFYNPDSVGSSGKIFAYRPPKTPILTEFKVTKDKDLINLQADGLSLFRVSSSGDVYTQVGGTINTSGADLAERYTSQEELDFGDVVSIDPQNNHGVKKTTYQYQHDALGVVSTDPGFVAGAYTENSYPVALVGRVPVKVSTENGMIKSGDRITPASVSGYAMKATLAGHIIGHALESMSEATLTDCPPSDTQIPGRKCGKIMVFVNLADYLGEPIDDVIVTYKNGLVDESGLSVDSQTTSGGSSQDRVLGFLDRLRAERSNISSYKSEVFADRLTAVTEIISPSIFSRNIKADSISGLIMNTEKLVTREVVTDSILINSIIGSDLSTSTATSTVAVSFDNTGNAFLSGILRTLGGLVIEGHAVFSGGLVVDSIGSEDININIIGDTTFFGRPYFTKDTAGSAVVRAGSRSVDIVFEKEYIETPIVSATIALENSSSTNTVEEMVFEKDIRFIVTRKGVHGFTILLNKPISEDVSFSWIALSTKGAVLFSSIDEETAVVPPTEIAPEVLPTTVTTEDAATTTATETTATTTEVVEESTIEDAEPELSVEETPTETPIDVPVLPETEVVEVSQQSETALEPQQAEPTQEASQPEPEQL
ncbi:MAG: hypothetical protein AB200_01585, partial [Parcubacteria bacterium C7867-005]